MSDTRNKLLQFLRTDLAPDRTDVDFESDSLVENGVIDSIGIMRLVEWLENELGVKVEDDELLPEHFDNVDAIVALLQQKGG